ncbi:hypothetical protein QF035_009887 [Streptomyces umbrinus]|uniref:Uncharacterized protein n=1 Tax=Streptomyces umbrinus TaxID=67370 RepID=A0ABU0T926_9ACTN|nr:hypothetical protein [Streptomyces umbrinus]MDQ1032305.1 hypothetical protein [Streptomyces umbrinus]
MVSPFDGRGVGKDGSTAYATVTYGVKADELTDATKMKLGARDRARLVVFAYRSGLVRAPR